MTASSSLQKLLYYSPQSVFLLRSLNLDIPVRKVQEQLREHDRLWMIDGNRCKTAKGIFSEFQSKMFLPDCGNWDGFVDWLSDMSWVNPVGKDEIRMNQSHFVFISNARRLNELNDKDRRIFFEIIANLQRDQWNPPWRENRSDRVFRFVLACADADYAIVNGMLTDANVSYVELNGLSQE
ncbi:MAG: barstar family protein [Planctomycetia bacterium]|nr:barstar family protein [Planctomycetia bacterium]